jgi:riboflavin biosynthesis pyrimidine reductase
MPSGQADFAGFMAGKTQTAAVAPIERLSTNVDGSAGEPVHGIGNEWSRRHYGGAFNLYMPPDGGTALSLVFVQSKNGNTGAKDPSALGGGPTDEHLIYEGLSRVAADAVLAGAGSIPRRSLFSVWHPELVALRASLGLARHPAQVVVSKEGRELDLTSLVFNVPDVPVFLLAGDACLSRHTPALRDRTWIRCVPIEGGNIRTAIDRLRSEAGIRRISAIGGRSTASHLVDAGVAQDLYLTTASRDGGEPGTPWYTGPAAPPLRTITQKQWTDRGARILFEHILIGR